MDSAMLLADKNSYAWNFGNEIKDYISNEKGSSVPLQEVSIDKFRNGELDIHIPANLRQKDVYFIQDSNKNPQQWWIELLLIKDLLLNSSARSVIFVLPNILYSRKDRKDRPHVPISARALAESISPGLSRIITVDLHAEQIQSAYPANVPIDSLRSSPYVVRYLREKYFEDLKNLAVVSPDAGGADRAKDFIEKLDKAQSEDPEKQSYSFALISKTRLEAGKVRDMELVGDVEDKNVLIIDDIIDSGGTLQKATDLLKEKGARKLFCYATHGIFTKGTEDLAKKFDSVMTSNTHYQENNDTEVVDLAPLFAEAIYRAYNGFSISKLFE